MILTKQKQKKKICFDLQLQSHLARYARFWVLLHLFLMLRCSDCLSAGLRLVLVVSSPDPHAYLGLFLSDFLFMCYVVR